MSLLKRRLPKYWHRMLNIVNVLVVFFFQLTPRFASESSPSLAREGVTECNEVGGEL